MSSNQQQPDQQQPEVVQICVSTNFQHVMQDLPKEAADHYVCQFMEMRDELKALLSTRPIETIEAVMDAFSKAQEQYLRRTEAKRGKLPCKKGCSHCCYMRVAVSEPEAQLIMKYVDSNNVQPDLTLARAQLASLPDDSDEAVQNTNAGDWWYQHMPTDVRRCMFLENEVCSIYSVRPLACRNHVSGMNAGDDCMVAMRDNSEIGTCHFPLTEVIISAYLNAVDFKYNHMALALKKLGALGL
jgi:Fe-S-cluster containining protein